MKNGGVSRYAIWAKQMTIIKGRRGQARQSVPASVMKVIRQWCLTGFSLCAQMTSGGLPEEPAAFVLSGDWKLLVALFLGRNAEDLYA